MGIVEKEERDMADWFAEKEKEEGETPVIGFPYPVQDGERGRWLHKTIRPQI